MNNKWMKGLSIGAAVVAAGANLIANVIDKKDRDTKIAEECAKAVSEALSNKKEN